MPCPKGNQEKGVQEWEPCVLTQSHNRLSLNLCSQGFADLKALRQTPYWWNRILRFMCFLFGSMSIWFVINYSMSFDIKKKVPWIKLEIQYALLFRVPLCLLVARTTIDSHTCLQSANKSSKYLVQFCCLLLDSNYINFLGHFNIWRWSHQVYLHSYNKPVVSKVVGLDSCTLLHIQY